MLGNDVVDLVDPESQPDTFRPRFDDRVFSAEEQRVIARDPDPLARRWAHWGAKEAAFKLARRMAAESGPRLVFSPRRLVVEFEPRVAEMEASTPRRGTVRIHPTHIPSSHAPIQIVEVRSIETSEFVHVVAVTEGFDWGGVEWKVEEIESLDVDPSTAGRRLAIREIARSLGVAPTRLHVGRAAQARRLDARSRVPSIELDGEETSLALSLSHHGRFVSYAMAPALQTHAPFADDRGSASNSSPTRAGA